MKWMPGEYPGRRPFSTAVLLLLVAIIIGTVTYPLWGKPRVTFVAKRANEKVEFVFTLHHVQGLYHVTVTDRDAMEVLWGIRLDGYYPWASLQYGEVPIPSMGYPHSRLPPHQTFPAWDRAPRKIPVGRTILVRVECRVSSFPDDRMQFETFAFAIQEDGSIKSWDVTHDREMSSWESAMYEKFVAREKAPRGDPCPVLIQMIPWKGGEVRILDYRREWASFDCDAEWHGPDGSIVELIEKMSDDPQVSVGAGGLTLRHRTRFEGPDHTIWRVVEFESPLKQTKDSEEEVTPPRHY